MSGKHIIPSAPWMTRFMLFIRRFPANNWSDFLACTLHWALDILLVGFPGRCGSVFYVDDLRHPGQFLRKRGPVVFPLYLFIIFPLLRFSRNGTQRHGMTYDLANDGFLSRQDRIAGVDLDLSVGSNGLGRFPPKVELGWKFEGKFSL